MLKRYEKHLPAKLSELNNLLAVVEESLEKEDCPMKEQTAILVCLEELFVNIASYAFPEDGSGEASLILQIDDEKREISVTLSDNGVPFDPLKAEDPDTTLPAEERKIGGLGIFMVKKMMDSVLYEYTDGFNITTMIKKY